MAGAQTPTLIPALAAIASTAAIAPVVTIDSVSRAGTLHVDLVISCLFAAVDAGATGGVFTIQLATSPDNSTYTNYGALITTAKSVAAVQQDVQVSVLLDPATSTSTKTAFANYVKATITNTDASSGCVSSVLARFSRH